MQIIKLAAILLLSCSCLIAGQNICPNDCNFCGENSEGLWVIDCEGPRTGSWALTTPLQAPSSNPRFQVVNFFNASLAAIPARVLDGFRVVTARFSSNPLGTIADDAFQGILEIEELDLNNANLSELSQNVFSGLTSIRWLDLSHNDLGVIPGNLFLDLVNLEGLDLGNNDLENLPIGIFRNNANLQSLVLRHNRLSESVLPEGVFTPLVNIRLLDLTNNLVQQFNEVSLGGATNLEFLDLAGNPLHCACANIWILKYKKLPQEVREGYEDCTITDMILTLEQYKDYFECD